jgi:class 3 adenylate cyclase
MSGGLSEAESKLWQLIERRCQDGADTESIDRELWETFGQTRAIMFTDLSGFSRRVAEFGIVHFLQVIHYQRQLLQPLVAQHGGQVISAEADSLLVVFPDVPHAVDCALTMQRACDVFNQRRKPEEQLLLCLGIGYGKVLMIGDENVWGAEVNAASKLGEDTAGAFEVLMTGAAKQSLVETGARYAFEELADTPAGAQSAHRLVYDLNP